MSEQTPETPDTTAPAAEDRATPPASPAEDPHADVWAALAAPFDVSWIEKLPKPLARNDDNKGRCTPETPPNGKGGPYYSADGHYCNGWHARSVHLDYIGHAGITMRLNAVVGPGGWQLEPLATNDRGLPVIPERGEFWARLTILGVPKVDLAAHYNTTQEAWGDALRRTAMRFGIGTYLWAKSEYAAAQAAHRDPDPAEERLAELAALAQAAADAITQETTLEQLEELRAAAVEGDYLGAPITVGDAAGTLLAYLDYARSERVKVEAPPAAEQPQQAASAAEEGPAAPPAAEETQAPPAGQEGGAQGPTLEGTDLALELARSALEESNAETLRDLWNMADANRLLDVDVIAVIGDDDLAAVDLVGTVRLPLRGLLIAANGYVGRHGNAIRDLGEPAGPQ